MTPTTAVLAQEAVREAAHEAGRADVAEAATYAEGDTGRTWLVDRLTEQVESLVIAQHHDDALAFTVER
ncbi:hypothetical protein ACWEJ7_23265 [Streptomyces albidoflavus]